MFLRLPGVEPGSIAWKAIILTVGLQTLVAIPFCLLLFSHVKKFDMLSLQLSKQKLIYSGGKVTEEFVETEYYKDLNCVDKEHHTVLILPPTVQFCFSLFLL